MAFSNKDLLSWFCATNPIPEIPDEIELLKGPGCAKMAEQSRLTAQAQAEEDALAKQRLLSFSRFHNSSVHDTPGSISGRDELDSAYVNSGDFPCTPQHPSYESYEAPSPYNDAEELYEQEDFGPGKSFNPEAQPGDDDYLVEAKVSLYDRYNFDTDNNPPLPIESQRERIVRTIQSNSVTVIQGETGSGKSTQVAQYILDDHSKRLVHCNIVCTQPRRIAATSIAKFVARCRGWELGSLVGYQIGMDKMVSEDTRVTFVTTGVLLEKLINMKNMNQFTHIILDEVRTSVHSMSPVHLQN